MIPRYIHDYLVGHGVKARTLEHPTAITAQELAQSVHFSGKCVAKTVAFIADGEDWLAVIPAHERLDLDKLRRAFHSRELRVLTEAEFSGLFPGCAVGAEPPFGRLFGVPVIMDSSFQNQEELVVRGGSHEQALLISSADLERMEAPAWADIGLPMQPQPEDPVNA